MEHTAKGADAAVLGERNMKASQEKLAMASAALWSVLVKAAQQSRACPTNNEFCQLTGLTLDAVKTVLKKLEADDEILVHRKANRSRRVVLLKSGDATGWTDRSSPHKEPARRARAAAHMPSAAITVRPCMCCGKSFDSTGHHHRMCANCRVKDGASHEEWRVAV